jgi:hypothetical protein
MRVYSRRHGVALVAALSLLALLGLLIVAAVAASSMSQRATRLSLTDGPLLDAADFAAAAVLADPSRFGLADLPLQRAQAFDVPLVASPGVVANVSATRLPFGAYWIVGESAMPDADAGHRRVGLLARTAWIARPPAAPFVARGSTTLSSDVVVLVDTAGEPDCTVPTAPPPVQTADSSIVFAAPGQWAMLAAAPGVRLTSGDTTLNGGSFEGILMVVGDLTIDGPFDATGLIVARGRIRSTLGFPLTGARVSQANAAAAIDLHGATVRYAPCLVGLLLRRASPIVAVRPWRWTELF